MLTVLNISVPCSKVFIKICEALHSKRKFRPESVVLIAERIKPRIMKIGYALRKKGYRIFLFVRDIYGEEISNTDAKFYDWACLFHSSEELYCRILMIRPLVYHVFTEAPVGEWADYIVRRKDKLGKIVYDQYDVYRGLSRLHNRCWEKREKYCFENADGLCCRSFESQYLKKRFHYQFSGKRILFFDYCWNRYHDPKKRKKPEESLQIIYGGRILSPKSKDVLGRTEWEAFTFLAEHLRERGGTLTVIPLELTEEHVDFLKLAESNPHFRITKPMGIRELIKWEKDMDYGIDCLEFQNRMAEYMRIFANTSDYCAKARYYATNKFFDYIDAGTPIIYGRKGELFGRYFERLGAAVSCAVENIPDRIEELKENRNRYTENVRHAREVLSIEKQIDRLIVFYKSLQEENADAAEKQSVQRFKNIVPS